MLVVLVSIYTLYTLLCIYTSVVQIRYVAMVKEKRAVLLHRDEFVKAGNYTLIKEKLSIVSSLVDYLLFTLWIVIGVRFLEQKFFFIDNDALKNIAIVMSFILINHILSLPFSYYEKFVIDQKFGFNKSTLSQWIRDTIVSFITMILIGSFVVFALYEIMKNFEFWWLWSFCFVFALLIIINMAYPTFRAIFFDKLKPLEDEALESEIKRLMDATGFVSSGVFISDASKRDSRLNAYFGGFGKTKRVVLFDTLLQKLSQKELLAVLGHELGHFAHGDIYKNIALMGGMFFVIFALFGNLPDSLYMDLGVSKEPYTIMILLMLFMPVLGFVMMPLIGIVSRENEYEADKTGGTLVGEEELASALIKLVTENRSFPFSHPLYIFFHYTHPPVIERLKALGVDIESFEKEKAVDR